MTSYPEELKKPPGIKLIIVTGMEAEAKLVRAPGVLVITGCGDSQSLLAKLNAAIGEQLNGGESKKAPGILSFGIAGGLAPYHLPGTKLIARRILGPNGEVYPTDPKWTAYLASTFPQAKVADFAGVDLPLVSRQEKAALYSTAGALAADMESHIAAKIAQELGLAFAAARVIADGAEQDLPHAAQVGLRPNGKIDFTAVAKSVFKSPRQLPALWQLGRNTKIAFDALLSSRQAAGEGFGFFDLG